MSEFISRAHDQNITDSLYQIDRIRLKHMAVYSYELSGYRLSAYVDQIFRHVS